MVHFIPNIISVDECKILSERFNELKKTLNNIDVGDGFENTFGFKPEKSEIYESYLEKLKKQVNKFIPDKKISGINTYIRRI